MKFENTKVYNIVRAVYSARNPMNSWAKSLPYANELLFWDK